jgi:hypothetical protein
MNDPCDPDDYDEDTQFASADAPDRFVIRVSRNAVHAMTKDAEPDTVASESALYIYEHRKAGWFYCAVLSGTADQKPDCQPNLPVIADEATELRSPFVKRVN